MPYIYKCTGIDLFIRSRTSSRRKLCREYPDRIPGLENPLLSNDCGSGSMGMRVFYVAFTDLRNGVNK